jgi:hypothetical protein
MTQPAATYADAPESLISQWEKRRGPLGFAAGEALPPLDVDLNRLAQHPIAAELAEIPQGASGNRRKQAELYPDLIGNSALAMLNGLLIAHLRKRSFPDHAPALFLRIWHEQADQLMSELSTRWLISALITFGDHGETPEQQSLAREMAMLFSLMKLYEFERLFSGTAPEKPFELRDRVKTSLPMDMPPFALATGGLDINLLAPLWQRACTVPVAGPLACLLLDRLNHDPRTLFCRINAMREKRRFQIEKRKK